MKTFLILSASALILGCSHLKEPASKAPEPPVVLFADTDIITTLQLEMEASVNALYTQRNNRLIWFDSLRLSLPGDSLRYHINHADYFGLIPDDYHRTEIETLLRDSSELNLIRADILLTDGYFTLRHHIKHGRLDSTGFARRDLTGLIDSAGIALVSQLNQTYLGTQFQELEPEHTQYQVLKDSLQQWLAEAKSDSASLYKIETLKLNMERWRRASPLPSRHLVVNVPSFMMKVVEDDSIYLESRVIVGKPENATPLLEGVITSFVIYPYWHVPRGIAVKEILPLIQRDSSYLQSHQFDVLDKTGNVVDPATIDWLQLHKDNFPYVLRQRDGRENALGIIKFLFNNPYNVYLHDTNGRGLFKKNMRALSHGCVRVHKAVELARYLVKDDNVYVTPEDLDQYLSLQQRYQVKVVRPIPLFIRYFTCEPGNSALNFYADIYKKDSVLNAAILQKRSNLELQQISGL